MNRLLIIVLALGLIASACTSESDDSGQVDPERAENAAASPQSASAADEEATDARTYAGTTPAPEFPEGLDWLNTAEPLTLRGLQGKIVLLDFWTYGCINCIHIIPDLERLEEEFAEELVVIGVHSAKFVNESATNNIRQVILRYGLEHPVVNDRDFAVWNTWGANAWPTTVLIDPAGNIVGGHSGEGIYPVFQPVIESLVNEFDDSIDRAIVDFSLERQGLPDTILSFPGKVLATDEKLFIADSNHHRIVVADRLTGDVTEVFGSGLRGFENGTARDARFADPQGLALSPGGEALFVADTSNHAIRVVDLVTGNVETIAGNGVKGSWPPQGGAARSVGLHSPWDLAFHEGRLYIAMAGTHQIWVYDPGVGVVGPVVGSGRESTRNDALTVAELAQPSGLAFDESGRLYFADSESSSIRWADVTEVGSHTGTLAGSDANLFDFGDVDGVGTEAKFQHPLGVAYSPDGAIYVADTYNSKIRKVDIATGQVTTLAGGEGWADGSEPRFHEPGGLSLLGDELYVADTNNHAIRVVDTSTGSAETLVLKGIARFAPPPDDENYRGLIIGLDQTQVASGPGTLVIDVALPAGYKINELAPSAVQWTVNGDVADLGDRAEESLTGAKLPVTVPVVFSAGFGNIIGDVDLVYCREEAEDLCLIQQLRFTVPVTVAATGSNSIVFPHSIELPDAVSEG